MSEYKSLCERLNEEITRLRAENERLRESVKTLIETLEYYQNPYNKAQAVPDYYAELGFGDTAEDAIDLVRKNLGIIEGVTEPVSPWRDIESAPRDGTDFLALIPYNQKHHQMVGCFASKGKFRSWPGRHEYHPTHWMPLPEPPR